MRGTCLLFVCLALALAPLAGCGGGDSGTTTPAFDANVVIVVESQRLVPVSSRICHVQGTLRNLADGTVRASVRWQAFDAEDRPIATTAILLDVPAAAVVDFDATGFFNKDGLVPCSSIARFERIFDVATQ